MFIAFRKLNVNAVDHSGNREYHGGYTESKEEAEEIAKGLNDRKE
jgi:hypothetical protein